MNERIVTVEGELVKKAFAFAITVALALGVTQAQAANLTVSLSGTGLPTVTCADGALCDTNPLAGVVTFTSTLGTATVSLGGTASGTPALNPLDMDLSYNLTATAGSPARTYVIAVSENGLSGSGVSWSAAVGGTQTNGATTSFASFADATGTLFGTGTSICGAGPTGANPFTLTCSGGPFSGNNFSLTEQITIVAQAGVTSASGDASLTAAEPATLLLLGSGLVAAALGRKRLLRRP